MIEYFASHPLVVLILVLLAMLTVFVCVKAARASQKRYAENEKIMKKLKEDNRLRNDFAVLTPELIVSAKPEELFRGVALNLEKRISDAEDMEAEFALLSEEQRKIYALYFVAEDGAERLSDFFAANGKPLTDTANEAVKELLPQGAEAFGAELLAFDGEDETTSFVKSEIERLDKEFAAAVTASEIAAQGGWYIFENPRKFI